MQKPLLSIVIPIYNLENYVVQALDSIYSQGIDESFFEVVAVDDGSKDNSYDIIKKYSELHTNMLALTQPNGGVSKARNTAIEYCKGSYITFLDADDRFAPNSLNQVIKELETVSDIDIIYCRTFAMYPNREKETHLWGKLFKSDFVYSGMDLIHANYINGGSVCGGIYKREFIQNNNLTFAEGVANCEDTIFNYILYSRNPSVIFIDVRLILVTVREGSASRSYSIYRANLFENNINYLLSYRKNNNLTIDEKMIVDMALNHSISMAVNMYIRSGCINKNFIYNKLHLKDVLPLSIKAQSFIQKLYILILDYCFPLYIYLKRIRKSDRFSLNNNR